MRPLIIVQDADAWIMARRLATEKAIRFASVTYKRFEYGVISAVNTDGAGNPDGSYAVQVADRAFPYDRVSPIDPNAYFLVGDSATLGFHQDVVGLPEIISAGRVVVGGQADSGHILAGNGLWLAPEALASLPYGLTLAIPIYPITNSSPTILVANLQARTLDGSLPTEQAMASISDPRGVLSFTSPSGAVMAAFYVEMATSTANLSGYLVIQEITVSNGVAPYPIVFSYPFGVQETYSGGFAVNGEDTMFFDPDRHGGYAFYTPALDWYTWTSEVGIATITRGDSTIFSTWSPWPTDTLRASWAGSQSLSSDGKKMLVGSYHDLVNSVWDTNFNGGFFGSTLSTGQRAAMWSLTRDITQDTNAGKWTVDPSITLQSLIPGGVGRIFGVGICSCSFTFSFYSGLGMEPYELNFDTETGGGLYNVDDGGWNLVTPGTGDTSAVYDSIGFNAFEYGLDLQIKSSRWPEISITVGDVVTPYWWFYINALNSSNIPKLGVCTCSQVDDSLNARFFLTPPGGTPSLPYPGYLTDQIAAAYTAAAASRTMGSVALMDSTAPVDRTNAFLAGTWFLGDQLNLTISMGAGSTTSSPSAPGSPARYFVAPIPGPFDNWSEEDLPINPVDNGSTTSDQSCSGVPDEAGENHYLVIFEAERIVNGYSVSTVQIPMPGDANSTLTPGVQNTDFINFPEELYSTPPVLPMDGVYGSGETEAGSVIVYNAYHQIDGDSLPNVATYSLDTSGAPTYGDRWRTYLLVTPVGEGPVQKIEISQLLSWNGPNGPYELTKAVNWPGFQNVFGWIPRGRFLYLLRQWVPTNDLGTRFPHLQILQVPSFTITTQAGLYNLQPPSLPTYVWASEYQPRAFVGYDSNSQPHITVYSAWDPPSGADTWGNRVWSRTRIAYAPDPNNPGGPSILTRTDSMDTGYPAGAPTVAELAASAMDQNGDLICLKNAQVLVKF